MITKFTLLEKIFLKINLIPHPVLDSLINIQAGRALQVSLLLGIFDYLHDEEKTVDMIASACDLNKNGAIAILDCLCALEYLSKNKGYYSVTKRGKKFLFKSSKTSVYNTVLFSDYSFKALIGLEKNLKIKEGHKVNLDNFTKEQWDIFNNTMLEMAKMNCNEIISKIRNLRTHKKLLDVGGSHGLYSIAACEKNKNLIAEIFDLPQVQEFSEKIIKMHNMGQRVKFVKGDFFHDNFSVDFDIAFLFNIIHGLQPEANQTLFSKIYRSLNGDSQILIMDQIKDVAGNSQLSKLMSSSMGIMLYNQAAGRTYSFSEICSWLQRSGFKRIKINRTQIPGFGLISAQK